jgi:hypothetical protein
MIKRSMIMLILIEKICIFNLLLMSLQYKRFYLWSLHMKYNT